MPLAKPRYTAKEPYGARPNVAVSIILWKREVWQGGFSVFDEKFARFTRVLKILLEKIADAWGPCSRKIAK